MPPNWLRAPIIPRRGGLTRVELVVVALIILLLAALLLPSIQRSSNVSRRQLCTSHRRTIGVSLAAYEDAFRTFPPGATTRDDDPTKARESIHALLLQFLDDWSVSAYQVGDWQDQPIEVLRYMIPLFSCPSSDGDNPLLDKLRNELLAAGGAPYPASQLYGTTNYVFCRGVTDAWCRCWLEDGKRVPRSERGMFDVNWSVRPQDVTDGLSKTIAVAEGADGSGWDLVDRTGGVVDRHRPGSADKYGMP